LLSLPYLLADKLVHRADPREVQQLLYTGIVKALDDLAYQRALPPQPNLCPYCGSRKERS
jgi:hypothetical protein